MEIKVLKEEQISEAVQLARGVYDYCIRPQMTDQELVQMFLEYAQEETVKTSVGEGALVLYGAFEKEQMIGMAAMQAEGHITMLYVLPAFQRRGAGKRLLEALRMDGGAKNESNLVTLAAAPAWTAGYFAKRGFRAMNLPQPQSFVQMEAKRKTQLMYEKKPIPAPVVIATSLGGLAVCVAIAVSYLIYLLA